MPNIVLSIIIPAYNEENRLPTTLAQVCDFLQKQPFSVEVLVVENGSQDRTWEIAQEYALNNPGFRALHVDERGKGRAVQLGMLEANGEYRFMCDVDLSMPIDQAIRFMPPQLVDFDIAIASREAQGSIRYNEPAYRHMGGRAINLLIRTLALPGYHDTQCGFKCFRAEAAEKLFRKQTLTGWSFDIELLYAARLLGYKIVEVPIPWYFSPESKLNVTRDAIQMARDILTVRKNARLGLYN